MDIRGHSPKLHGDYMETPWSSWRLYRDFMEIREDPGDSMPPMETREDSVETRGVS